MIHRHHMLGDEEPAGKAPPPLHILYMNVDDLNTSIAIDLSLWYCAFFWLCNPICILSAQVMHRWYSVGRGQECFVMA
jgi:hypothetical protein